MTKKHTEVQITSAQLMRWAQMTDENYHAEVRYEIARFLAQFSYYFDIYEHMFLSYMNFAEEKLRGNFGVLCSLTDSMFEEIRKEFGEEVADKISKCL